MGNAIPRSASAIISSVEVLAQYAAIHGITDAQDALMDILASVHGWNTELPGVAEEQVRHRTYGPDGASVLSFPQPGNGTSPRVPRSAG